MSRERGRECGLERESGDYPRLQRGQLRRGMEVRGIIGRDSPGLGFGKILSTVMIQMMSLFLAIRSYLRMVGLRCSISDKTDLGFMID